MHREPTAGPLPQTVAVSSPEPREPARHWRVTHASSTTAIRGPTGYVEASRGCCTCALHCPIPRSTKAGFSSSRRTSSWRTSGDQVQAGATHITFGDPDFLNGPRPLARDGAKHARGVPGADVRFHGEDRAYPRSSAVSFPILGRSAACSWSPRSSRSATRCWRILRRGTPAPTSTRRFRSSSGGHRLPADVGGVHPGRRSTTTSILDFIDQGLVDQVDPVQYTIRLPVPPGSMLLDRRANHRFWGRSTRRPLAIGGPLPTGAWTVSTRPSPPWWKSHAGGGRPGGHVLPRARPRLGGSRQPDARRRLPWPVQQRKRPPRLTEPWFCCAEPTEGQFGLLQSQSGEGI